MFILDGLVDASITRRSFDVDGVETPHVGLVEGYPILERISFWTPQYTVLFYLGVVEFALIMLAASVRQKILAGRDLGRVGL